MLNILCCFGFVFDCLFIALLVIGKVSATTIEATTYAIKFQFLPASTNIPDITVMATHADTIDNIKDKIVAEVNRGDFSKHGFRVMRNGKYCDELWRRVLEYGTGPAIWSIVIKLRGGGKSAKQTILKDRENRINAKMTLFKQSISESAQNVSATCKESLSCIGDLEQQISKWGIMAESNAAEALQDMAYACDGAILTQLLDSMNASGSGTAESKVKQFGNLLLGEPMTKVIEFQGSLNSAVDASSSMVSYIFAKACSENKGFTIKSFKTMLENVQQFKKGQAAAAAVSASTDDDMNVITEGLGNLGQ